MKNLKILLCLALTISLSFTTLNFSVEQNNVNYAQAKSKYPTKWTALPSATVTKVKTLKKGTVRSKVDVAIIGLIAGASSIVASKKSLKKENLLPLFTATSVTFVGGLAASDKMEKSHKLTTKVKYSYREIKAPIYDDFLGIPKNNYIQVRRTATTYDGSKKIKTVKTYEKVSSISYLLY